MRVVKLSMGTRAAGERGGDAAGALDVDDGVVGTDAAGEGVRLPAVEAGARSGARVGATGTCAGSGVGSCWEEAGFLLRAME